ncbi:MAG: rubrerythrin [Actinobacteria bacterium]|nr:rubrerythrin [Actinomycetota bacterium]
MIQLIEEAIEYERMAAERYRQGAQAADDPETRTLFEQLVRWEEDHERILHERLTTLKLIRGQQ